MSMINLETVMTMIKILIAFGDFTAMILVIKKLTYERSATF